MPKSALIDEDVTRGATVHAAINGISEDLLKDYVGTIEDELNACDEIMRKARAACQPHIDQIKDIKKDAENNGIPKKPLAAKLAERRDLRRAEGRRDTLSEEQREIFDEISLKLDDLPLFKGIDG